MTPTQIWCGSCGNQRDLEILDLSWDDERAVIIDRQETVLPFWWPWFLPTVAAIVALVGIGGPLIFPDEVVMTDEEAAAADAEQPEAPSSTTSTTSTIAPAEVAPATTTTAPPQPSGPLLGIETGLRLLSLGGGATTRIVDLDTAKVEHFDFRAATNGTTSPLLMDGQIVAAGVGSKTVRMVPVDDLDAEPLEVEVFETSHDAVALSPSDTAGRFWVLGTIWGESGTTIDLVEVDLATATPTLVFSGLLDWRFDSTLGGSGLVVSSPEGPRLINRNGISDWPYGLPLTIGPGVLTALVCDHDLACGHSFIDLDTGGRVPLDFGTEQFGYTEAGRFTSDGGLYASFNWHKNEMQVFEVATGGVVASFPSRPVDNGPGRPAWSPAGDWLAWRDAGGVVVAEVGSGTVHHLPVELVGHAYDAWSASLVFLE